MVLRPEQSQWCSDKQSAFSGALPALGETEKGKLATMMQCSPFSLTFTLLVVPLLRENTTWSPYASQILPRKSSVQNFRDFCSTESLCAARAVWGVFV